MKRLLLVLTFLLAAATAHAQTATVVLQWLPQAQFAGFYVAKEKGFYAERDVDLTLISGGPDVITSELLESRRATFATMFLSTGIQRRAAGIPIVNIAQLAQHSGMMLLAKNLPGSTASSIFTTARSACGPTSSNSSHAPCSGAATSTSRSCPPARRWTSSSSAAWTPHQP